MARGSLNGATFCLLPVREATVACRGHPHVSVLLLDEGTSLSFANTMSSHIFTLQRRYFGLCFLRAGVREEARCFPLLADAFWGWIWGSGWLG